jgi:ribosome-associated protein
MVKKIDKETLKLQKVIIEAIQEKKGDNIISIDLSKIEGAVSDFFIITSANSTTQVNAISDEIEKYARQKLKEKVWKKEGQDNSQWVLLDYGSIVVHVFQTTYRDFYKIEELWADGKTSTYES